MKKLIPLLLLLTTLSVSFKDNKSTKFLYKYEIRAATNSTKDLYDLYSYKEHLIETYEKVLLTTDSSFKNEYLNSYIETFDYKDAVTKYVNGVIIQKIGKGFGKKISGDLRVSECDEEPIREKFYIFDLFNN